VDESLLPNRPAVGRFGISFALICQKSALHTTLDDIQIFILFFLPGASILFTRISFNILIWKDDFFTLHTNFMLQMAFMFISTFNETRSNNNWKKFKKIKENGETLENMRASA